MNCDTQSSSEELPEELSRLLCFFDLDLPLCSFLLFFLWESLLFLCLLFLCFDLAAARIAMASWTVSSL